MPHPHPRPHPASITALETQAPAFPTLNSSDNCPDLTDSCLPQMKSCRLVKVPPKMSGPKMSTFTAPWTL